MKYSFFPILLLLVFSFLEMTCSTQKEIQISAEEQPIIFYEKERCRGFCPAYTLEFFEPNKVRYKGTANMEIIGEKNYTISKAELATLKDKFKENSFKKNENEYLRNVMDIPKITLIFDGHSVVFYNSQAPQGVKDLSLLVEKYLP